MTEAQTTAKRIIVTGATGLVGKHLCTRLMADGYQVVIFSRSPQKARQTVPGAAAYVEWNAVNEQGNWINELSKAHGVVHLAGASIFGQRWTESYKARLRDSRIVSTRMLVDAMATLEVKPAVFVSGSAVGYYGSRDDTRLDETAAPGNDFLAKLSVDWEHEAARANTLGIRTVFVRTGIVLDADEGALPLMKMPFLFFMGGPIMPGTQWLSWVHVADEVGIIMLALENEQVHGPINATAPEPQMNRDFCATLGEVLGKPSWMPVPEFSLKMLLGEFADSLVTGQRAIPQKALDMGYQFQYPTAEEALRQLLKR